MKNKFGLASSEEEIMDICSLESNNPLDKRIILGYINNRSTTLRNIVK